MFWITIGDVIKFISHCLISLDPCYVPHDSSDVIYVSGEKKGRGEENHFKTDGRKGKRFSSPSSLNVYDVTGIVFLKVGQFGFRLPH